ncbi:MAG: SHOCT domain-containing protein [Candidatus Marinimicrobia bacterium]|nr:SHOCT domain-containing protein [Candidatus Neomarinimicrobiota bacterium]
MEVEWMFGLFFLSMAVGIAIRAMTQPSKREEGNLDSEAIEIAEKRYAKGEISAQEFERMKSNLKSTQ